MFSRPFRKQRIVPLATHMRIYRKGGIVHIEKWALFKKEHPTNATTAKPEKFGVFPNMRLALLQTAKLRAGFLPRELMCILSLLSTLRAEVAS